MDNFVVFLPDQLRADALTGYGNTTAHTPNFSRLADAGVQFDQCHTQSVLCTPSRCSMLTGWYPHVRGHRNLWHLLQPEEPNLFRYLRNAGYDVALFGKNDVFAPQTIPLSLDQYQSEPGANTGPNSWSIDDPHRYSFLVDPFPGAPDQTSDARHVRAACEYIRSRKGSAKPFFVFIPLTLPHPPYGPPEPWFSRYSENDVTVRPIRTDAVPEFHELVRTYRRLDRLDEGFFRKIRAVYYGMVEYVDWMLGTLLDTISEEDLTDDTWVIASSDHGDLAGDYGLVEKIHNAHYDPLTRVPLIVRGPGVTPRGPVAGPVALMDLMATVLDIAGVEATHSHYSVSLRPVIEGKAVLEGGVSAASLPLAQAAMDGPSGSNFGGAIDDLAVACGYLDRSGARAVFTENGFRRDERHCFEGSNPTDGTWNPEGDYYPQTRQHQERPASMDRVVTMRTAHDKLTYRPTGLCEYYDLQTDPEESRNLIDSADHQHRIVELERELLRWHAMSSDSVPFHHDPRGFPVSPMSHQSD
jgi:arylsulfatase A-like enzyme